MEDYERDDVLAELVRLCDELGLDHMDSEAMACKTHIFVDASGNPHECWEAGPGHINVTVAMTPEQAVRITDVMTENAKLRKYAELYAGVVKTCGCDFCPYCDDFEACEDADAEPMSEGCALYMQMSELGIEVRDD